MMFYMKQSVQQIYSSLFLILDQSIRAGFQPLPNWTEQSVFQSWSPCSSRRRERPEDHRCHYCLPGSVPRLLGKKVRIRTNRKNIFGSGVSTVAFCSLYKKLKIPRYFIVTYQLYCIRIQLVSNTDLKGLTSCPEEAHQYNYYGSNYIVRLLKPSVQQTL